jgi:hypothetical protein
VEPDDTFKHATAKRRAADMALNGGTINCFFFLVGISCWNLGLSLVTHTESQLLRHVELTHVGVSMYQHLHNSE